MSAEEQTNNANTSGEKKETTTTTTTIVGTTRKAEGEASGDAARAKPKAHVAEDDELARALGGMPTAPAPVENPSGPDFGLREGDRMEVRWVVSDDNAGEAVVWWPCTLRKPSSKDGERDGGGTTTTTWELHYDAKAELGFASEIRVARLTGPGTLEDVAGSGEHDAEEDKNDDAPEIMTLRWRREGTADDDESPEHSDDDDDDDGDVADVNAVRVVDVLGMKPEADGSISLHAVHDAQRRADRTQISRGGEGLEDAGNRAFATMPMAQQQFMATKFMGFKEGLASALQELMRTNGPDYVITKDDVDQVMAGLRR